MMRTGIRFVQDALQSLERWREKGIFAEMLIGLAADHGEEKTVMIDDTYLKPHRKASSLAVKKGSLAA